jgi:hypothetical protein
MRELASCVFLVAMAGQTAWGQKVVIDPLRWVLMEPALILHYEGELDLTPEQAEYVKQEIKETHARFAAQRAALDEALEGLYAMLKEGRLEQQLAVEQLDQILDLEGRIKRGNLEMAIRIRAKLTDQQLGILDKLRQRPLPPPPPPPPPPAHKKLPLPPPPPPKPD